ncbi:T9SS type A sorting domain-containing protein [Hymenobacter terricola]|uniref:T9SS type A sorting domain-containing protein n=1 Tax=Hymenobacter terricola TaxID=2819236 RepID=UPI001B3124E2|nr:T9SS type A sorting domain-containing protein [Hymenobacter terricola]
MNRLFPRLIAPLLCVASLGLITPAQAAYVPVVVTGFTADVVANGVGTVSSSTTADVDGGPVNGRFAFMAPDFVNPAGSSPFVSLPATGLISSATTGGLSFQLAAYTANNSLRILGTGTGALTLATPQSAGSVYLLATSGNGASTATFTVTFTDQTTQVFSGQNIDDWYGGHPVVLRGVGRVNYDDNSIDNDSAEPSLYQVRLALAPGNYAKVIQRIDVTKTSTSGTLNVMAVSLSTTCTGTPTAGAAHASVTTACAAVSPTLSLTGKTIGEGIGYQWQSSTNNGATWNNISGATDTTFTVSNLTVMTQYRAQVTCLATNLSAISAPVGVTVTIVAPTFATLPFLESFENTWLSLCATHDTPSNSWRNTPATGPDSWRRDDDGASANWIFVGLGGYSPASSLGAHSATFHTFAGHDTISTLDLFVDLSTPGPKRLSFDFVNVDGPDSLLVQLSTDGGTTFTTLGGYHLSPRFTTHVLPISSTSATAVVRFRSHAFFDNTDIGLDNVRLAVATGCLTPANLTTTTAPTTTTATVTWLTGGTGTYTVLYGPTGFDPAQASSPTNAYVTAAGLSGPPFTATGLTSGTPYQYYVLLNCAAGVNSGLAGPAAFSTQITNDEPCGATPLTLSNVCSPLSTTNLGATTTPASVYASGSANVLCGNNPRPNDVWFTFTTAATGPTSTQVRITVAGATASVVTAYSGPACAGPLTYLSCSGSTNNQAASPLDLLSLTPSTTYFVRVSEFLVFDNPLDSFTICAMPVPNCAAPTGLGAGALTPSTATLSWALPPAQGGSYTLIYGLNGFSPTGTGGTTLTGLTGTSTTLTSLSPATGYCFYLQQVCGGTNGSSNLIGPFCFTTTQGVPANDEPCNALPLGSAPLSSSNVGGTTSFQTGINTPACSPAALPKDVWFSFAPAGPNTTLTLTGTAAGMVRVFTSPSCSAGPFNQVFCQGVGNNTNVGPVPLTGLTPGQRYYVAVSGYGSSDTPGPFTITATNLLAAHAEAEAEALRVFPNPSGTGQLTLRLSGPHSTGQAALLNALGQVVRTQVLNGASEQALSTVGLAPGLYTLRVTLPGQAFTRKVILE